MVRIYFSDFMNVIRATGITKKNKNKGIYHIKTWRGGQLYRSIGIDNALQVKQLTITGIISVTDLYFIQQMENLEVLNLKNAIYFRKKLNAVKKNLLKKYMAKQNKCLKEIWFPKAMRSVPSGLFKDCITLERVILSPRTKVIGMHAFSNSGIKELTIPSSVNSIEASAFSDCPNLKTIRVEDSHKLLKWKGVQFKNCPSLHEIYLGRNSRCEYALQTDATLSKLTLGKKVYNLDFNIPHIKNMICLMKHPPYLNNNITAENIFVEKNLEQYWLHPQWHNKKINKAASR